MTREEAISFFKDMNECTYGNLEAVEMAIKALEQQSNTWSLDDAREDFMHDVYNTLDFLPTNNEANRIIDSFDRVTSDIRQESCYNPDEWCHDCSEYDQDKHCCPRFNKVIRSTVEEIKQQKVGHWISYWDEEARCYVYKCPECGNKQPFDTKHCWECGTRLVEPQESKDKE